MPGPPAGAGTVGRPEPLRWFKGHACSDRLFYAGAADPRVVGPVRALLGARLRPHDVAYSSAGEQHGIRNRGTEPAVYLVFEFHPARRRRGVMAWLRQRLAPARRLEAER